MELDILVIEDEPSIVRMLEPTLQASGARVMVAWSGSQALEYIANKPFDVILCDLGLPDIDGSMRRVHNCPFRAGDGARQDRGARRGC